MLYVANLTAAMRKSFAHMPYYSICSATCVLHLDVLFSCPDKCLLRCAKYYTLITMRT